jgi:ABC-type sugar transport system substrate-binding protein
MKIRNRLKSIVTISAAAGALLAGTASPVQAEDHYKVFLDMSYSGNSWQASAANGIKAGQHTALRQVGRVQDRDLGH